MNWLARILILAILTCTCTADSIVYMRVHRDLIEEHLKLVPPTEADRIHLLHRLFDLAGCPQVVEQHVPNEDFPNVICILPGEEEGRIIVGASSDSASADQTSSGGWNSLVMLPLMAESLSHIPHRLTLMFIAFTGHEHAAGALWYAKHLTDLQRKTVLGMVDLDDLGRTPPVFALAQSDDTLAIWLQVASKSLHIATPSKTDISAPPAGGPNDDPWADLKPFEQANIPAIAVRSVILPARPQSGATLDEGGRAGFDINAYEDTYRLMCVYALYLDRNLGKPLIEPGIYSGKIVDTAGVFTTSPIDVSVTVDRFTTAGELNRYELILQKGGQAALADALSDENEKGALRFGLDLGYGVKLATLQTSSKGSSLFLVAPRVKDPGSINGVRTGRGLGSGRSLGNIPGGQNRFTIVKLDLDEKGGGEGVFYSSAKLGFNKKHELIVEDFGSKPDVVRQVRLERPPVREAVPVTTIANINGSPVRSTSPSSMSAQTVDSSRETSGLQQRVGTGTLPVETHVASPTATFHAKAQLVQVDVSVTDSQGRPIRGLQQSDFAVLEDGTPQEIRAFEAHMPAITPVASTAPPAAIILPPHTYTNKVIVPAEDTLNILLLDLLNTPITDQAYARKRTIEFLKTLPPGKRIAMFVLSGKLVMVQGFTDDSGTMVAAAEKVLNDRSMLLTTESERQQFQGAADSVSRIASPDVSAPGGSVPPGAGAQSAGGPWGFSAERERSNAMVEGDRTSNRVNFTLDSLAALARSVTSYPGRKNLVWLSGSFPVRLKPSGIDFYHLNSANSSDTTGLVDTPDFSAAVKVATTALATARIAVFPIDVRGLTSGGVDMAVGAAESASFAGIDNPEAYKQNLNIQSETRFTERSSMEEVAHQTGGEVQFGNDVSGAIARAIEDGSTYYTVAYTPAEDTKPRFRNIQVKVDREKVKLAYRPGYYSGIDVKSPSQSSHPLIVAMQPGMPASTVIPLTVQVLPADDTSKKLKITYTIDIQNVNFADTPDHKKRAIIDCVAVAFNKEGLPVGQVSNAVDATLTLADYESSLRNGLPVIQELALPPGQYSLRLGVMDRGSQKIGTLDVPLTVAATRASK